MTNFTTIYLWDNEPYIIEKDNKRYIFTLSGWKECAKNKTPWN